MVNRTYDRISEERSFEHGLQHNHRVDFNTNNDFEMLKMVNSVYASRVWVLECIIFNREDEAR